MARQSHIDNGKYVDQIREMIRNSGRSLTRIAIDAGLTPEQLKDILNNQRWLRAVEMDRIIEAVM